MRNVISPWISRMSATSARVRAISTLSTANPSRSSLPHPEQLLGVQDHRQGVALLGACDEVAGPSRAVSRLAVPEGDQGNVLAAFGKGVVEHPEIVALPDGVVLLLGEPGGQLLRLGEHPYRQRLGQPV